MASSSSSPSAMAYSSQLWKYHVFLSFRGEDTRKTFVDHLYTALVQQGICTYKDDETLPRDSSWCLKELAYIMKCRDTRGQIVLPIFYDMDPSEVRKQTGKYGEAFVKHEVENKTIVETWRKALVDASNISGWEPRNIANGHESEGIKQIVVEISHKVHVTSSANENLIGIAVRMQCLKSELQIGSGGVLMIGIWGVGGGGKSTLASSVYGEICRDFDGCCFVENIREEARVKVLIQKALITVSEYGEFDMHDLVQEMGHYIVRVEHPKNPEKRSRVWENEDVRKISAMDATTELDKIEAIKARYDSLLLKDQNLTPIVANMKNLRYIEWELGDPANPLSNNFPPRELCCLILSRALQKQLWDGCKLLPNLKIMELWCSNLIMTPDFGGLPNLERFKLKGSWYLEEIHSSIGRLEKLVSLCIEGCVRFKTFPPISRLKKLETLSFSYCPELFNLTMIQHQNMDNLPHLHLDNSGNKVASHGKSWTNSYVTWFKCCSSSLPEVECCLEEPSLPHNNMNHIGFQFFHHLKELGLRKLDLSRCDLRNEVIGSDVWVLPNLQELNLAENKFSRLSFRHVQFPRLKWLNVSYCYDLVELSELPLSIAVVIADGCSSLETFGDISNCKWLWKVSVQGGYKLGPLGSDLLLDSILQGNAIQDHFISVTLQHKILKGFVGRLYRGDTFTMRLPHVRMDPHTMRIRLPHDGYNDFCGFLIRVVTSDMNADISIIIKQEPDEDPPFELWQDSKQAGEPKYDGDLKTYVGYVSFNSLRRTTLLNLSYDSISFSIKRYWTSFSAELVSRKGKDDLMQTRNVTADCSEFWDDEDDYRKTFRIQHVSKSSINILWRPSDNI
ncbi:unnamed protein product [Lactuca saligna]|uniref:TIR domain-containing protein n=1 Tax=Lactuca saligna TaxID=75948 RepID=A0AA35ZQG6_LACSI|nr:unnamed protein product [Lactuca saligna]